MSHSPVRLIVVLLVSLLPELAGAPEHQFRSPGHPLDLVQVLPVGHHHDAVADRAAEQRHKPDERPDVENAPLR